MCGIVGFITFDTFFEDTVIVEMTNSLHHRGPDDYGFKNFETDTFQLAIGHRRLSILDTSENGHQPMRYKYLWTVYNGEVYNFKGIREKLIELGHSFKTESDTEVILHAFEEWNIRAVDHFIGMFAFLIYDELAQKCYLFRDRAGVKPLHYYDAGPIFMFASELKAFHKHPAFKKEIDVNAMAQFFKYEFIHAPNSIFKNVKKLLPGNFLIYDLANRTFETHQYWKVLEFFKKPRLEVSYDEAKIHVTKLMKEAFSLRMVSDVPVGVFLSGGYDSSLVSAMLQKEKNLQLKTFTIGFDSTKYDESAFAEKVANLLETEHHKYTCTEAEALEIVPKLVDYFDEPFGDPSLIPTILLSKKTSELVTVSLSADGGDEIFFGYNSYEKIYKYYQKQRKLGFASSIINFVKKNKFREKLYSVNVSNENATAKMLDVYHQKYKDSFIQKIFADKIEPLKTNFSSNMYDGIEPFHKLLAIDYTTYMPDNILVKVDRATMSASLEGREPLLDHRIVEYVAQLPLKFLFDKKTKTKKRILRDICHDYLPEKLMNRKKTGFTPPILDWLRNELKPLTLATISEKQLNHHGLLNAKKILKGLDAFMKGNDDYYNLIWNTLVFQLWYNKWMKDE